MKTFIILSILSSSSLLFVTQTTIVYAVCVEETDWLGIRCVDNFPAQIEDYITARLIITLAIIGTVTFFVIKLVLSKNLTRKREK